MTNDFSLRKEIEILSEQAGLKLSTTQIDSILDEVVLNDNLLSVIIYYIKKEIVAYADKEKLACDKDELDYEYELGFITEIK